MLFRSDFPRGYTRELFNRMGQLSGAAAFRLTVETFRNATAMLLREAPAALRAEGVEALLIDQTSFGGATLAHRLDLPFVSVSCALLLNPDPAAALPPGQADHPTGGGLPPTARPAAAGGRQRGLVAAAADLPATRRL